jgi:hypothetical protein
VDLGRYYAILASAGETSMDDYMAFTHARRVAAGFSYDSGTNPHFLSVDELRAMIFAQPNTVADGADLAQNLASALAA